ncbi:LAFE_0H01156g1_1 [Lachancea fermentati]|uniref:6-phosphogluconolactonase-like protein n=1 Tax=Lachancea fermentati TaxID=4955 RepID=A0A1G4MJ23_LACFM|nr:LAFE_0H01156g1_1 [Lachancea fermentati]
MVSVHAYEKSEEVAHSVGKYILEKQNEALARGERFNVAISGGSLVKVLYKSLVATPEIAADVKWAHWHVYFCDERIVALEDEDSNYGAFKKHVLDPLLEHQGALGPTMYTINESLVGLGENDRIANEYETLLPPQFDLILLGCGPDGHTCSLFPGDAHRYLLDEKDKRVAWCHDSPKPPSDRITFTLPVLQAARNLGFVAEGASKQPILKRIFENQDLTLPCALVNHLCSTKVAWFVDSSAVQGIDVSTSKF